MIGIKYTLSLKWLGETGELGYSKAPESQNAGTDRGTESPTTQIYSESELNSIPTRARTLNFLSASLQTRRKLLV